MTQSEAATTRPARKRAVPAKATVEVAATPPAVPTEQPAPATDTPSVAESPEERIPVVLEFVGRSKRYDKWAPVDGSEVSGTLYAPPGTLAVKALLIVPKVS